MRIIIADTSAVVRAILEQNLQNYPDLQIIASVPNARQLEKTILEVEPDVILCGLDLTEHIIFSDFKKFMSSNQIPVLFLGGSEEDISFSKDAGIADAILKPKLNSYDQAFFDSVFEKLKKIISQGPRKASPFSDSSDGEKAFKILCLGASTGGPSAVSQVLKGLGKNFPLPVLYAQHIEVGADENLASWLAGECHNIHVTLAKDGEEAKPGHVYMAPADKHLVIDYVKANGTPVLRLSDEEPERFLRPAVNKLFRSCAHFYKQSCLAILLTGMGMDGADGCRIICDKGGWTIVEDKSTCTVFGMPAAAIEAGGAKEVLPRGEISKRILELVKR